MDLVKWAEGRVFWETLDDNIFADFMLDDQGEIEIDDVEYKVADFLGKDYLKDIFRQAMAMQKEFFSGETVSEYMVNYFAFSEARGMVVGYIVAKVEK